MLIPYCRSQTHVPKFIYTYENTKQRQRAKFLHASYFTILLCCFSQGISLLFHTVLMYSVHIFQLCIMHEPLKIFMWQNVALCSVHILCTLKKWAKFAQLFDQHWASFQQKKKTILTNQIWLSFIPTVGRKVTQLLSK